MAIGGGGMMGSSMQQQHGMQQQASWQGQGQQHAAGVGGGSAQVIVSGISSQSTPQAAKTTFEQFGRIGSFLFHRHPTTGALLPLASIEFTEHQAAANAIRAAQNQKPEPEPLTEGAPGPRRCVGRPYQTLSQDLALVAFQCEVLKHMWNAVDIPLGVHCVVEPPPKQFSLLLAVLPLILAAMLDRSLCIIT